MYYNSVWEDDYLSDIIADHLVCLLCIGGWFAVDINSNILFVIWQAYCGHLEALSVIMNFTVNLDLQDNRGKLHALDVVSNACHFKSHFL